MSQLLIPIFQFLSKNSSDKMIPQFNLIKEIIFLPRYFLNVENIRKGYTKYPANHTVFLLFWHL